MHFYTLQSCLSCIFAFFNFEGQFYCEEKGLIISHFYLEDQLYCKEKRPHYFIITVESFIIHEYICSLDSLCVAKGTNNLLFFPFLNHESNCFGESVLGISESNKVGKINHSCLDCSSDNTVQNLVTKKN